MGINPEDMIKKAITETIIEELFRDLGFYVLKFGKETTISPLIQLEQFIKICEGKFKLEREDFKFIYPISYVNKLPDFLIVNKSGDLDFLEVKYRYNAVLWDKDSELFSVFPESAMIVVNSTVSDDVINQADEQDKKSLEKLKETRFHIWTKGGEINKEKLILVVEPLKEWLEREFNIKNEDLLKKYELLVSKWIIQNKPSAE